MAHNGGDGQAAELGKPLACREPVEREALLERQPERRIGHNADGAHDLVAVVCSVIERDRIKAIGQEPLREGLTID